MIKEKELSKDQEKILSELPTKESGAYLITGHAGTGKTFVACELIKDFLKKEKEVLCLAPTHQAKIQLQSSLPPKTHSSTIASFLKVKASRDPIDGRITFSKGAADQSIKYNLIVVDECSMLSEDELKEILKLKDKCLLVFLGDFNQLPPVNKASSQTLFSKFKTYELTTQHRNSGDVLKLCDDLRTSIKIPVNPTNEIDIFRDRNKFLEALIVEITQDPDPYNISYLGFTNKEVKEVRNLIHELLYQTTDISVGQYLRLESRVDESNVSEIIEILSVDKKKNSICGVDFDVFDCEVENIFSAKKFNVKLLNYDDQDLLETVLQEYYEAASKEYKKYTKELNKTLKEKYKEQHKRLLEIIKESDKITMVSSPFALTIHKAQGRTIPVVYLNTIELMKYGRENKRALMYVGCSRTKNNLKILKN